MTAAMLYTEGDKEAKERLLHRILPQTNMRSVGMFR